MLEEKLRKKNKKHKNNENISGRSVADWLFSETEIVMKIYFLGSFLNYKINSTFSNEHTVHRQITYSYIWLYLIFSKKRVEKWGAIWMNSYNVKHNINK